MKPCLSCIGSNLHPMHDMDILPEDSFTVGVAVTGGDSEWFNNAILYF